VRSLEILGMGEFGQESETVEFKKSTENIAEKQFSRNPVISRVLAKVDYIEELGEGWDKIIREHKNHPLKPDMLRSIQIHLQH